jgi:hypothetical protein
LIQWIFNHVLHEHFVDLSETILAKHLACEHVFQSSKMRKKMWAPL